MLHSPGTKQPDVLTPILLLAHEIEREIFLKKIESLQYSVREQKTINARLNEELKASGNYLQWQKNEIKLKNEIIAALHRTIIEKYHCYKNLFDAWRSSFYNCKRLSKINDCLIKGMDCKVEILKVTQAIKLPIHLN